MSDQTKEYIIHDGYEGFVKNENEDKTFNYTQELEDAKLYSSDEIGLIYNELEMDHPASETSICTALEAKNLKLLKDTPSPL